MAKEAKSSVRRFEPVAIDQSKAAANPILATKAEELKRTGGVSFSSADLADFSKGKAAEAEKPAGAAMAESTELDVKPRAKEDPLLKIGGQEVPSGIATHPAEAAVKIKISPAEKEEFIEALVTGDRLVLPFSIFGGKVAGHMRSRRQDEAVAVFNMMASDLSSKSVRSGAEQVLRVRFMLLACQLAELNGRQFAELAQPLGETVGTDGKVQPPGWMWQLDYFASLPEGMVTALFDQLKDFETKYWTMVNNAGDQNFWKPGESS